jgi:hypothetical protein
MIGNEVIKEVIKELVKKLTAIPDLCINASALSRMGKVYSLGGKLDGLLYLKTIGSFPHHWGITKNTIDNIEKVQRPWCIVLIYDSYHNGYVISSKEYRERVAKRLWPFHQGNYKITEGKSLKGLLHFSNRLYHEKETDGTYHLFAKRVAMLGRSQEFFPGS